VRFGAPRRHAARGISKQIFTMVVLSPLVAYYTRKLVDNTLGRIFPSLGACPNRSE
jgi:hypothetical protein